MPARRPEWRSHYNFKVRDAFNQARVRVDTGPWADLRSAASAVREQVFIIEQGIARTLEWDQWDALSLHAVARHDAGEALGTARLLPREFDAAAPATGHVGRMAVLAHARGAGVGSRLLKSLMEAAPGFGFTQILLNAQVRVAGFYARHGFIAEGDEFLEVDIPHVRMRTML